MVDSGPLAAEEPPAAAVVVCAAVEPAAAPVDVPDAATGVEPPTVAVPAAPVDVPAVVVAVGLAEAPEASAAEPRRMGRCAAASMLEREARLPQPEKRSAPDATAMAAVPIPPGNRLPDPAVLSRHRAIVIFFKVAPCQKRRAGDFLRCRSKPPRG